VVTQSPRCVVDHLGWSRLLLVGHSMGVEALVMVDMAGVPPRLMPGSVPTLGGRLRNALQQATSLEIHLSTKSEKVYPSRETALARLTAPGSFIDRW